MGEELRTLIEQAMREPNHPRAYKDDAKPRARMFATFFALYQVDNAALAELYLRSTLEIPLDKLRMALRVIVRSHHWPRLPLVADIWRAARMVAGMHREQYHAGRYMPAPTKWPPQGKRYAVCAGEYEEIGSSLPALTEGLRPLELSTGDEETPL